MHKISIMQNLNTVADVKAIEFDQMHEITAQHAYSPFMFDGETRKASNSTPSNLIIFDVDEGLSLEDAKRLCEPFMSFIATTKSHTSQKERFRIIVPVDRDIPKSIYKQFYVALADWMMLTSYDRSCNDLARFFYPNKNQEYWYSPSNELVSFEEIKALIKEPQKPLQSTQKPAYTRGLLDNELPSTFVFKDGSMFGDYEYLAIDQTHPIRCFNPHHGDKHPSAYIARSNSGEGRLFVHCSSCNETKFIKYEGEAHHGCDAHKKGTDRVIIPKNPLEVLTKFAMNAKKRKELDTMKWVISGLFVEGYHSYLYGSAGAGKTTLLLNLCFNMVERGYTVYFFYLDGELHSAAKVFDEIERLGIEDKYHLLTDGTMKDYEVFFKQAIDSKMPLNKSVFILDSFKFLSANILDKNSNKRAMHLIKDLCKLGATFISLGHTNKDSKRESGTAEIEQDSDAVLRIDSSPDLSGDRIISTISKGGRCRADVESKSYSFIGGEPLTLKELNDPVNVHEIQETQKAKAKDRELIQEIKSLLADGAMKQSEILEALKEFGLGGRDAIRAKLREYAGDEWIEMRGEKNSFLYQLSKIEWA